MSEGRPTVPTQRPPNARRRGGEDEPARPSPDELAGIERHLLGLAELAGARVTPLPGALLAECEGGGLALNYAGLIRWSRDEWEMRSREVADRLRGRREWPSLMIAEGRTEPADLTERLIERGWTPVDVNVVMWTRRAAVVPHLDPSLRLEAVTRRTAAEYESVERAIFGLSDAGARERGEALVRGVESGSIRAYVVRLHGEPVATARLSARDGIAALSGLGVVAEHRREGFGRLMTTIATRAGLATGNSLVWLSVDESNAPARRLYESLDYRPAFRWWRMLGSEAR